MKEQLNISILEDDRTYLKILGTLLEKAGIPNYKLFQDPEDFLNISNGHTHIAIIDHRLGDTSGLEVVTRLLRKNPDCFIIVISAEGSESIVAEYMNADCDRYIRKGDMGFREKFIQFVNDGIGYMDRFLKLKSGKLE